MLVKEFQDYILKLENASTMGNLDQIRESNKGNDCGICCQAILGNFWCNPILVKNINVVVEVLGQQRGSSPSFITNRTALIAQLIKNPQLSEADVKLLNFRLDGLLSDVNKSVREALLIVNDGKACVWADTLIEKRSVNESVVCFVISEIYNRRYNLGCYILMSQLGSITPNFDYFCSNPLVKEKIKEGVLSASCSSSLSNRGLEIIKSIFPEIYDVSIHGSNYKRVLTGA